MKTACPTRWTGCACATSISRRRVRRRVALRVCRAAWARCLGEGHCAPSPARGEVALCLRYMIDAVAHQEYLPMPYVDGFIVAVPKKNLEAYRRMANKAGKVWREHGALEYREWVADDVKVGKLTSFPRSVKLKPDETVIFSWIVYKSRAHRDRVNKKVMADKRLA